MMQVIAVHPAGTMPQAMEFDLGQLDFVQKKALARLPRSPLGVPELRALVKTDGLVIFKFKIPPEKLSWENLPELLTLWEEKYTDAMLKVVAREGKAERAGIAAAAMWQEPGAEPTASGDSTGVPATSACATPKADSKRKRIGKPKLPPSVLAATTTTDAVTGEVTKKMSAVDKAIAAMAVKDLIAKSTASLTSVRFTDPLELARLDEVADAASQSPVKPSTPATVRSEVAHIETEKGGVMPELPARGLADSSKPAAAAVAADKALKAIERHKKGGTKGPKLLEMEPLDLFRHLEAESKTPMRPKAVKGLPNTNSNITAGADTGLDTKASDSACKPVDAADRATQSECIPDSSGFEGLQDPAFGAEFESANPGSQFHGPFFEPALMPGTPVAERLTATASPVSFEKPCPTIEAVVPVDAAMAVRSQHNMDDWSGLVSFRLSGMLDQASALVLPTGERFEALGHLTIEEQLEVRVDWLQEAAVDADAALLQSEQLAQATEWLKAQLVGRSAELQRWLGKKDLVTHQEDPLSRPALGKKVVAMADWVKAGTDMAVLAQAISMDIAMLDLQANEIAQASNGMPTWALEVMQQMHAFEKQQALKNAQLEIDINAPTLKPGTEFRDSWRAELLRIDAWCMQFKTIRIARQVGLFGSSADAKLLLRLEQLLNRAKSWQQAPAHAACALAVWLAFILSLDHGAVAMNPAAAPVAMSPGNKSRHAMSLSAASTKETSHV